MMLIGPEGWKVRVIQRGNMKAYLVTRYGLRPEGVSSGYATTMHEVAQMGCPTGLLEEHDDEAHPEHWGGRGQHRGEKKRRWVPGRRSAR